MDFIEKRPLYKLAEIAAILRGEGGCPWDKKQTIASLKPYLIEEAYEVYDAIESGDTENLKEELGDLMFQIYSHARIAEEEGLFTVDDVAVGITEKLIRRHPHVFGEDTVTDADEVIEKWERIKRSEKPLRASILDGVPAHLPALLKAYRVQQKVSRVGFDWEKITDVIEKLDEEVAEFKEALTASNTDALLEEAGDILFSIVNILRFKHLNAEEALRLSTQKFIRRFKHLEVLADSTGRPLEEMAIDELEKLWEKVKAEERNNRAG